MLNRHFNEFDFTLSILRINPILVRIAFILKGKNCKIKLVGTINISGRDVPNPCLNTEIKIQHLMINKDLRE